MSDEPVPHARGCSALYLYGCGTTIGFLLGFVAAVVWAAWGGW